MAIDIADEMHALVPVRKRMQGQHRHLRPQVRATDADIHYVSNRLVSPYFLGIGQHGVQSLMHLGQFCCFVGAAGGGIGGRAQEHVPDFSAFGGIDFFAAKHRLAVRA